MSTAKAQGTRASRRRSPSQPQAATEHAPASSKPTSTKPEDSGTRSLELLAKVRSGELASSLVSPSDRQALVVLLSADGLSTPEIAQILKVTDRTIERDRRAIRAAHAVEKDPRLVEQMVGRLLSEAELCVQRIRRTTREREVDPGIKVDAEHRCFQIVRDLVQSLQRLGYLPIAAQRVDADLTHHVGEIPSLGDLNAEIERLKLVQASAGDELSAGPLLEVEHVIARASLASRVKDIATNTSTNTNTDPLGTEGELAAST